MLQHHVKLMHFFQEANEVVGRKKMQKMIYILQQANEPFEEKFQFHFYGPYSEELSLRVEELCNLGFLNEHKEDKVNYYQYRYKIDKDGEEFLKLFPLEMPQLEEKIALLQMKSSRFLELVSTLLYFADLSQEEKVKKIHTVKPKQKYTEVEIAEAFQFIEEITTVGTSNEK